MEIIDFYELYAERKKEEIEKLKEKEKRFGKELAVVLIICIALSILAIRSDNMDAEENIMLVVVCTLFIAVSIFIYSAIKSKREGVNKEGNSIADIFNNEIWPDFFKQCYDNITFKTVNEKPYLEIYYEGTLVSINNEGYLSFDAKSEKNIHMSINPKYSTSSSVPATTYNIKEIINTNNSDFQKCFYIYDETNFLRKNQEYALQDYDDRIRDEFLDKILEMKNKYSIEFKININNSKINFYTNMIMIPEQIYTFLPFSIEIFNIIGSGIDIIQQVVEDLVELQEYI